MIFLAIPDTAGPSGGSPQSGQRPPSGPSTQPRPQTGPNSPAGTSFGGQQPRPGSPSPPASPGFSNQPRPGGGSGSYSPQSGYKYWETKKIMTKLQRKVQNAVKLKFYVMSLWPSSLTAHRLIFHAHSLPSLTINLLN